MSIITKKEKKRKYNSYIFFINKTIMHVPPPCFFYTPVGHAHLNLFNLLPINVNMKPEILMQI